MVKINRINSETRAIKCVDVAQEGDWIHLEAPTAEELTEISELTNIPLQFLRTALDEEESARFEFDDDIKMYVIDIPKMTDIDEVVNIFTLPLAIITNSKYFVTVCTQSTTTLNEFFCGKIKNMELENHTRLLLRILYNSCTRYLYYLSQVDKKSELIQNRLHKKLENEELMQLLQLQKTLVYFSSSLTANYSLTQKLFKSAQLSLDEMDRELIDDVMIENKQAIDICNVHREIIKSTMDAVASIINNKQNIVMKFLTAITLIISIPMLIASLWGMNTAVPLEGNIWGFWIVTGVTFLVTAAITAIMVKKKMF